MQRAVCKDLVLLMQKGCLFFSSQLKAKGELSFERDVPRKGGGWERLHSCTYYRDVCRFCSGHHLVRFYFLVRAYSAYVKTCSCQHAPHVVVMNSCLRDLPRYGQDFPRSYLEGLQSLFGRLDKVLPEACLLVWNTALPMAEVVSGASSCRRTYSEVRACGKK